MRNVMQLDFEFAKEVHNPKSTKIASALEILAQQEDSQALGAVFTRGEVVDFILDLVGYTEDQPLYTLRLLEPCFGDGHFLRPVIQRLLSAWRKSKGSGSIVESLGRALQAVELHHNTFHTSRQLIIDELIKADVTTHSAQLLADRWLVQGDFLLTPFDEHFDFIVGNPPYVRQELIPAPLLKEYRRRYQTIYDRADLYIPFIERSLLMLKDGGNLGLICADRWMKNRYGGPLRNFIAENFHLKIFVDMAETQSFHQVVDAYPAITVIRREKPGVTRISHSPTIDRTSLSKLARELKSKTPLKQKSAIREIAQISNGTEPWLLGLSAQTALLRRFELALPTIEEAGCKVGIGVATGADKEFIGEYQALDVEPDRKLPLVMTRDIVSGEVQWRGLGVINPFQADGHLVKLAEYPRLARYLNKRKDVIAKRHCARKSPSNWYRTIDRISPDLAQTPKLLIPDIKINANIVFEPGELYPHHNLYYITSATWNLRALQAVLLSSVARLFITAYSIKMRGGYLRYQAQYLRRIRIPYWQDVPIDLRAQLIESAERHDIEGCNEAVYQLYGLTAQELIAIGGDRREQ